MSGAAPVRDGEFVEMATRRFREALTERVQAHEQAGHELRQTLGEPGDLGERAVLATVPEPSPWDEVAGPFTRSEGAQARLGGISRQAVAAKAARRRLLRVVTVDGVHLYPVWQFAATGGMLPGLADVLALFPERAVDGWTLAGWLRSPEPELGEAPLDGLLRGDLEHVLAVARSVRQRLAA